MADANPSNNPAGGPPTDAAPASAPIDQDILDTLGLGDSSANADAIASKGDDKSPAEPPAAAPAPIEAGGGDSAPPPPDKSPEGTQPPPSPAAPTQPAGKPQDAPAPSSAPAEPPAAAPPKPPEADPLRVASLEATVDALRRELEAARASPAPRQPAPTGQPAPAPSTDQPAAERPFKYDLTLPEATRNALLSDDPQDNIKAINAIVNDLGTIVHNTVLAQVRAEVRNAFGALAGIATESQASERVSSEREAGRNAYFTAFPGHKDERIEPLIRQQALQLSAEYPHLPFNEQFIAALGARVNGVLESLGAQPTAGEPAQPPNGGNTPPPKPAGFVPGGPRGGDVTVNPPQEIADEIMGTLSPFG
jgi:hypothetical protein